MKKKYESPKEPTVNEKEQISELLKLADKLVSESPVESKNYSKQALELLSKNSKLLSEKELAFYLLALANHYEKNYEEALKYYLQSFSILEQIGKKADIASSATNIGTIYLRLRNYPEALKFYKKSLEINLELGNKKALSDSYHNLALLYRKSEDCQSALQFNLKALALRKKLDNVSEIISSLNNTAITYDCLNNYDKAIDLYLQALSYCEEIPRKDHLYSKILNNLGIVYRKLHNYDKALKYHYQALEIKEKINNKLEISYTLNNIGTIYFDKNDYKTALEFYEKALAIKKEIGAESEYVFSYVNLGSVYSKLGNIDKALDFYFKSLEIEKKSHNLRGEIIALSNIGSLFLSKKDLVNAEKYLNQGLTHAKELDDKYLLKDIYSNMATLFSEKKEFEKAFRYYKKFTHLKEELLSEKTRNKIIELETKFETEKKKKEAEIFRLKNVELLNLNETLKQNVDKQQKLLQELSSHREHLNLINKILRHDLINDFSIIRSAIRIFQESHNPEILDEAIKHIDSSVALIRRMKELETMIVSNTNLQQINVNKILRKIIAKYPKISYKIIGKCEILADEAINSVFENIIRNSIQHGKTSQIDIVLEDYLDLCRIKFSDYGKGIPNSIKEKIFEEGFKYGKKGNLGLGMFIIRKTIERYGGKVEVKDNIPFGTSIVITIPKSNKK
ncbi:MAG: hypothetical protein DRZ79_01255 [Candidatus Cloacimonadota bacterium]|nr:MAG: hypothetical protein DRZ79_01255 [Candidatus Cloacimonadota bacterium]